MNSAPRSLSLSSVNSGMRLPGSAVDGRAIGRAQRIANVRPRGVADSRQVLEMHVDVVEQVGDVAVRRFHRLAGRLAGFGAFLPALPASASRSFQREAGDLLRLALIEELEILLLERPDRVPLLSRTTTGTITRLTRALKVAGSSLVVVSATCGASCPKAHTAERETDKPTASCPRYDTAAAP